MSDVPTPPAGRDLLVFCDGTSNTLTAGRRDTHVLRLYEHVRLAPPDPGGRERIAFYDPGVGAPDAAPPTDPLDFVQRLWERLAGLASGRGVYENIAQAYLFLVRHWRGPQDRIFIFGFSRGAFTARAVAGMVNRFGLVEPQHETLLPTLLNLYFAHAGQASGLHKALDRLLGARPGRDAVAEQIRRDFTSPAGREAQVHWVGVWDTVESVGLAIGMRRSLGGTAGLRGKRIRHVRHALALDERRLAFVPQLYEEPGDITGPDQTLEQRWFPGAHTDVGGGQPKAEAGLAEDTLAWMAQELSRELAIPPWVPQGAERVRHDELYTHPWWALVGMTLRRSRGVAVECAPVAPPTRDVWAQRRPRLPLLVAAVLGLACLWASGLCLLAPADPWTLETVAPALAASSDFAALQLASLWGQGLADGGPWHTQGHPAWAMAFDLLFVACWGYLLARVASRAFVWLAHGHRPGAARPRWLWLGLAPMVAVFGDVAEDLLTCVALALQTASAGPLVPLALAAAGLASAAKLGGLLACAPLLLVRYWLAFEPSGGFGPARRRAGHLYALLLPTALLLAGWGLARALVCWGGYGWLGALVCRGHYAIGLLLAGSLLVMWWLRRDLLAGRAEASTWRELRALAPVERRHVGWSGGLTLALLLLCLYLLLLAPIRF